MTGLETSMVNAKYNEQDRIPAYDFGPMELQAQELLVTHRIDRSEKQSIFPLTRETEALFMTLDNFLQSANMASFAVA